MMRRNMYKLMVETINAATEAHNVSARVHSGMSKWVVALTPVLYFRHMKIVGLEFYKRKGDIPGEDGCPHAIFETRVLHEPCPQACPEPQHIGSSRVGTVSVGVPTHHGTALP